MNVRILFKIDTTIPPTISGAKKNELTIKLTASTNTKEANFQRTSDNAALKGGGGTATDVLINDGADKSVKQDSFKNLLIVCRDEYEARKLRSLIFLEDKIKGKVGTTNTDAAARFQIKEVKYADDGTDRFKLNAAATLKLTVSDTLTNVGDFKIDDVDISNYTYNVTGSKAPTRENDYSAQAKVLTDLENHLAKLEKEYKKPDGDISKITDADIKVLNDFKTKAGTPGIEKGIYELNLGTADANNIYKDNKGANNGPGLVDE